MVRGYEMEMDILRDRMVRAERTSGEEAELTPGCAATFRSAAATSSSWKRHWAR